MQMMLHVGIHFIDVEVRFTKLSFILVSMFSEFSKRRILCFKILCFVICFEDYHARTDTNSVFNPLPPRQSDLRVDKNVACLRPCYTVQFFLQLAMQFYS
jgi:hypothetical protein